MIEIEWTETEMIGKEVTKIEVIETEVTEIELTETEVIGIEVIEIGTTEIELIEVNILTEKERIEKMIIPIVIDMINIKDTKNKKKYILFDLFLYFLFKYN